MELVLPHLCACYANLILAVKRQIRFGEPYSAPRSHVLPAIKW